MNLPMHHRAWKARIFSGRIGAAVVAAGVSLAFAGCASQQTAAKRVLFQERAPMPTLVSSDKVMAAAQHQAAANEGDFALLGLGQSMEPFYSAGTAVVVHPTAYHMLRPGMAVVYANPRGGYVAHMLLHRTERGWVAIGLNNQEPDNVLVTAKNLVGIIKHAFVAYDAAVGTRGGRKTRTRSTQKTDARRTPARPKQISGLLTREQNRCAPQKIVSEVQRAANALGS